MQSTKPPTNTNSATGNKNFRHSTRSSLDVRQTRKLRVATPALMYKRAGSVFEAPNALLLSFRPIARAKASEPRNGNLLSNSCKNSTLTCPDWNARSTSLKGKFYRPL